MTHRPTKFGRYHAPEAPSALARLHFHRGEQLRPVDHEPKIAVLDQEDLLAQGIRCSQLIPGATDVDALGSCTANATTSALSNALDQARFLAVTGCASYQDTKGGEEFAIRFYHAETSQTGQPAQEWPPSDCGSSGPYIVQELQRQGLAKTDRIAHGAQNIVSLLQTGGLLCGMPFLNAWMQPDPYGFIDGNGSLATLEQQIAEGVAGGHEIYLSAIERLELDLLGRVVAQKTVLRFRNSWTAGWGDHGSARLHLSTLTALGNTTDIRQIVV